MRNVGETRLAEIISLKESLGGISLTDVTIQINGKEVFTVRIPENKKIKKIKLLKGDTVVNVITE